MDLHKRPLGLTLFECLLVIAVLFGLLESVTARNEFFKRFPALTPELFALMQFCGIGAVVAAVGVFQFRRWGLWLQIGSLTALFVLEASAFHWDLGVYRVLLGLLVLLAVIWPVQKRFE